MGHDVVNARNHLIAGHRHGKLRIEHGEFGKNIFSENVTYFQLFLAVGDDRAAVHLAARARHGQNASDRHYGIVNVLESVEIFDPTRPRCENRYGHRFGIVRTPSRRPPQAAGRLLPPRAFSTPSLSFSAVGLGITPPSSKISLPLRLRMSTTLIVNSVFLDGTAAVMKHNVFAVTQEAPCSVRREHFPEIQFGGIAVSKVSKHIFSLLLTVFI